MGIEFVGADEEEAGALTKESGRRGQRLESLVVAARQHGKIHPDLINDEGELEGLLIDADEYQAMCEENDNFPDKWTSGVKSGLRNRYEVDFGYSINGRGDFIKLPADNDNFADVMADAQQTVDEALAEEDEESEEDEE